jgi:hypothetical protein
MALLVTLFVSGIGYALWTDEIIIDGTAHLGYVGVELDPGACSDPRITCSVITPHTLVITCTDAPADTYYCAFTITNTGTIPVKIQDIVISGVPDGVEVSLSGVAEGTQIEQAGVYPDSIDGLVTIAVQTGCEGASSFSVGFSFVQWNLYVEA